MRIFYVLFDTEFGGESRSAFVAYQAAVEYALGHAKTNRFVIDVIYVDEAGEAEDYPGEGMNFDLKTCTEMEN